MFFRPEEFKHSSVATSNVNYACIEHVEPSSAKLSCSSQKGTENGHRIIPEDYCIIYMYSEG